MRTKAIKNKINVITLGCSKNIYDSEVLISHLKNGGKAVSSEKDGNIVVINTCGFIFLTRYRFTTIFEMTN